MAEAVTGPACNICYSASADASYLTSGQGVTAIADAKFNSDCGYSGNTYAQAYARATVNTTTTTVNQEDPKTGTSVTSHAVATVNGSLDCYSSAYASVQSSSLGIYYDTSDNNSLCPAPPSPTMTVTMTGPSSIYFSTATCSTKTWSASVSGGLSPYSYTWFYNGTQVGTGTSYSRSVCYSSADFTIQVTVTDSSTPTPQSVSVTRTVFVDYEPSTCGTSICK
jgi:hypothetical protein